MPFSIVFLEFFSDWFVWSQIALAKREIELLLCWHTQHGGKCFPKFKILGSANRLLFLYIHCMQAPTSPHTHTQYIHTPALRIFYIAENKWKTKYLQNCFMFVLEWTRPPLFKSTVFRWNRNTLSVMSILFLRRKFFLYISAARHYMSPFQCRTAEQERKRDIGGAERNRDMKIDDNTWKYWYRRTRANLSTNDSI